MRRTLARPSTALNHRSGQAVLGVGADKPKLVLYIANRPLGERFKSMQGCAPLSAGEIAHIVSENSNHWRKAFNIFAKVLWQLNWPEKYGLPANSWQEYRDRHLLQSHSAEAMLFSSPLSASNQWDCVHWVTGKTYALSLQLPSLEWVDAHFAINTQEKLLVTPYVDYRQLTNERINRLSNLYHKINCQKV